MMGDRTTPSSFPRKREPSVFAGNATGSPPSWGRQAVVGALLVIATTASAATVELPKRKPGLWEIVTSQTGGPPGPKAMLCIDAKTDDLAQQLAAGAVSCSQQEVRRDGDRFIAQSTCRIGESTATTHMVFSGQFDSAYEVDIEAKYAPPLLGMTEGRSTVRGRWLGPCRPGQRPGDIMLPNGTVLNLYDTPAAPPPKR